MKLRLIISAAAGLLLAAAPCKAQKIFHICALVGEDQFVPAFEGFRAKMAELGYVDGKNVRYSLYNAKGDMDGLKSLAQKIVQQKPDLIVTSSTTATAPLAKLTAGTDLPIVFLSAGNPLKLVKSYSSSGNNLTGISSSALELTEKRLALVRELAPMVKRVVFLTNGQGTNFEEYLAATRETASRFNFDLTEIELLGANRDEIKKHIGRITRKAGEAVVVPPDAPLVGSIESISAQAVKERLPSVGPNVQTVHKGMLAAYSSDYYSLGRQGAKLVDMILRGAKPAELPIELPHKLQLAVNLKTARSIGLKPPKEILLRADEIIE
jgi:putative ABC transport system substrate-binding protein